MRDMDVVKTERLIIRQFDFQDCEFILALLNTPGWLQFIGDRQVSSLDQARIYLSEGPMASYKKRGFGLYFVGRREDGLPLGMCGLLKMELVADVEIGFAFLPEHMGKGYAHEAAAAVIAYAADTLKLSRLAAVALPSNKKSIGLLEKLKFRFEKNILFPGETKEVMMFTRGLQSG